MPFCMRIFEPPINDISSNKNNYNIYIYISLFCPMPYVHVLMYTETLHIAIKYHTVYIYIPKLLKIL